MRKWTAMSLRNCLRFWSFYDDNKIVCRGFMWSPPYIFCRFFRCIRSMATKIKHWMQCPDHETWLTLLNIASQVKNNIEIHFIAKSHFFQLDTNNNKKKSALTLERIALNLNCSEGVKNWIVIVRIERKFPDQNIIPSVSLIPRQ